IQYPSSRSYVSCTLYKEAEERLKRMFEAPIVVAPTTTLGHLATIPVLVEEGDVIIMDQQVHSSVQQAAMQMQLKGVHITIVRHNHVGQLELKIKELSIKHKKIWYACDGVYSMYGDCAPLKELVGLLDKYKSFYLYVDDAHGMSWAGKNGTGYALSQVSLHPKMVLATSLNKAFAAGGSVFVFANEELAHKVSHVGGPLIFAGQHQNAALGATIACANIHLSAEIYTLQQNVSQKIQYCQEQLEKYGLPIVSDGCTPIFFVGLGLTRVGYNLLARMKKSGFFANLAIFPAVSEACTGIRFTITCHHTLQDIEQFCAALAYHFTEALAEEGRNIEDIYRAFKKVKDFKENISNEIPIKKIAIPIIPFQINSIVPLKMQPTFQLQHETTIETVSKELWNSSIGNRGVFDWEGMQFLEKTFKDNKSPEHNWQFHYYLVKDEQGKLLLATFFTEALIKEDVLAPISVSKQIEAKRIYDPYYLTSKAFMMGSPITEGEHLFVNRSHLHWKDALMFLLDTVWKQQEESKANALYMRDFNAHDQEIKEFFMSQGFIKIEVPDTHLVDNTTWNSKDEFLATLDCKKRYKLKNEVWKFEKDFEIRISTQASTEQIKYWQNLYANVKAHNYVVNDFELPISFFQNMSLNKSNIEVVELYMKSKEGITKLPISVGFCFKTSSSYSPLFIGMNYNYLQSHNLYKQTLYQLIMRGNQLGLPKTCLGFTASIVKRSLGAKAIPQVSYIQLKDNYNALIISSMNNNISYKIHKDVKEELVNVI
nr:aminotransferase class I/II-fold pyridoxal phosphate-dependent enzyme [Chitinophagaceae bacterium]